MSTAGQVMSCTRLLIDLAHSQSPGQGPGPSYLPREDEFSERHLTGQQCPNSGLEQVAGSKFLFYKREPVFVHWEAQALAVAMVSPLGSSLFSSLGAPTKPCTDTYLLQGAQGLKPVHPTLQPSMICTSWAKFQAGGNEKGLQICGGCPRAHIQPHSPHNCCTLLP